MLPMKPGSCSGMIFVNLLASRVAFLRIIHMGAWMSGVCCLRIQLSNTGSVDKLRIIQ